MPDRIVASTLTVMRILVGLFFIWASFVGSAKAGERDIFARSKLFDAPVFPELRVFGLQERDQVELRKFTDWMRAHPRVGSLRQQGEWYVEVAQAVPTVLMSMEIADNAGETSFVNPRTEGKYSYGEAFFPLAFLSSVHKRLFPGVRVKTGDVRPFRALPTTIPLSPLIFGLIQATVSSPIHVLTLPMRVRILETLLLAPSDAFVPWEDDELNRTPKTSRDVKLKVLEALGNSYWTVSNSPELMRLLLLSFDRYRSKEFRAFTLKAIARSLFSVAGLFPEQLDDLIRQVLDLYSPENERGHLLLYSSIDYLLSEVVKLKWLEKDGKLTQFARAKTWLKVRGIDLNQRGDLPFGAYYPDSAEPVDCKAIIAQIANDAARRADDRRAE